MVRAGLHRDLVGPLTSDSPRLQVSALGLLRNLSVPAQNKVTIIEAGLLDTMMALSVVEQPAFFKVRRSASAARECVSGESEGRPLPQCLRLST